MADELSLGQERLGQRLRMERRAEGPGQAHTIREEGQRLVLLLSGLLRMTRVHAIDNAAFDRPVRDFTRLLAQLIDQIGPLHCIGVEDQIYINDVRVRLDGMGPSEGLSFGELLGRHQLGGISFHGPLEQAQLRDLLRAYAERPDPSEPRVTLLEALRRAGVMNVDLSGPFRFKMTGESEAGHDAGTGEGLDGGLANLGAVTDAWNNLGAGRVPDALPVRRLITEMLKVGITADGLWKELGDASPECAHSIRVALVALLIGESVGLSEAIQQDLGVSAIFHDIGYAAREGSVRGSGLRPSAPGSAPPYERHPVAGARQLLRQRGFRDEKLRRMLAVMEHHRDFDDGTGREPPSLFGRILRIAEDYDNLCRRGGLWLSPAEALRRMRPRAGSYYDPVLLQAFFNCVGKYPPGSVMRLEDGRQVRSVSLCRSRETWDKPLCYVYRSADGSWPRDRQELDLALEGQVAELIDG
jgi:hypothetical protein